MALGSYKGGGSSSLSNLSASAPPFTVDKPFPVPNSNPSLNLTDVPSVAQLETPAPIWYHPFSPNSGPNSIETRPVATSCVPSSSIYGYPDSQLNNSTNNFSRQNPTAGTAFDPFSYGGYSSGIATTFADPKPYYAPYMSPPRHNDCGLLGTDGASYDLLSNSGATQPTVPAQVDYTESMAGFEYAPSWSGFWNGAMNGKDGKWMDIGGTFGPKDFKSSGISASKSFTKQAEASGSGFGSVSGSGSGSGPGSCIGQYFVRYPGAEDGKSFVKPNPRNNSFECSKTSISGSTSSHKGSPHVEEPVLGLISNLCGSQNPYSSSSERFDVHTSSYAFDSSALRSSPLTALISPMSGSSMLAQTTASDKLTSICNNVFDKSEGVPDLNYTSAMKSSPISVIISPPSGRSLSTQTTLPSNKMTYTHNNVFAKEGDVAEYDPFHLKLPNRPLDFNFEFRDGMRRADSFFAGSSSTKGVDSLESKPDDKGISDKLFIGPPHSNCPADLKLKPDNPEALCSTEKPSDALEIHNHAVDSPCWKGAPTARFSPFEASDAVAPELLVEKLEVCNSLDNKGRKCTSNENTSFKRPLVSNSGSPEELDSDSMKQTTCCSKVNGRDEVQYVDNNDEYGNGSSLQSSETDSDAKVCQQQIFDNSVVASERKLASPVIAAGEKSGETIGASSTDGISCVMSKAGVDLLGAPSGKETTSELGELKGKDSGSMIDVNMLVNTMKNLSEVLRCHCTNNSAAVKGQDHSALEHIIENLGACMLLMKAEYIPPKEEILFPRQVTPPYNEELPGPLLSATLGRSQVRKPPAVDMGQLDWNSLGEDKRYFLLHRQNNDLLDSMSGKDCPDTSGSDRITQAIKRVLQESLPIEQADSNALLYKNLWLEAEAALCAFTIQTRFNRMMLEMDKFKHDKIEGSKNVQSSNDSSDIQRVDDIGAQAKDSPDPGVHARDSSKSSTTGLSDNVEVSIMDRFNILKARVDDLNSMKVEGQHLPIGGPSAECKSQVIPINDCNALSTIDLADEIEASLIAGGQEMIECHVDNSSIMKFESGQCPEKELGAPCNDLPFPGNTLQSSYFPSSIGGGVDDEASVMDRFHILKNRENSKLAEKDPQQLSLGENGSLSPRNRLKDGIGGQDLLQFGQHPKYHENKNKNVMNKVKLCVAGFTPAESCEADRTWGLHPPQFWGYEKSSEPESVIKAWPSAPEIVACEASRIGSGVLEGWYDCPASASDWEHVSKEEFSRQK
ncbi:hypothetical protein Ancab_010101 [Ancistrocladus abbreviatus]